MRPVPPPSGVQLLTPGEVATMLYVHPRTVTRWAQTGKLSSIFTPGGHRRFALSEVLSLMADHCGKPGGAPSTYDQVCDALTHDPPPSVGPTVAEAAEAAAAGALTADAAARALSLRRRAAREADVLVATEAARNAVAARIRADNAATRVREAAELAAASERALARPGDAVAERRATRTAATVQAAADRLAEETAALAEAVATAVATTAELLATKRLVIDRAIEAEVVAVATALALRSIPAGDVAVTREGRFGRRHA